MLNKSLQQHILRRFTESANLPGTIHPFNESIDRAAFVNSPKKQTFIAEENFPREFGPQVLFDNLDVVLFSVDILNNKLVQVSSACEKIYGYKPQDFYDNQNLWQECIHPEDRHVAGLQVAELNQGKKVYNHYRIINKNGEVKWLENKIIPTLNSDGILVRIDGISTDVSERILNEVKLRENEQRLTESEKKYRLIFEKNPLPMWLVEMDSLKFLDVNKAATDFYGYSREEFLSMNSLDIRPMEEKEKFLAYVKNWKKGADDETTWRHSKKDKSIVTVEIKADVVEFEGKQARLVLINDVTERIRSEKKLRQSNERYELVTKATNDALWDWNLCRNELYWSEGYEKLFGYKGGGTDVNVHDWTARIHPDDVVRVTSSLMQTINSTGKDFWEDEYRYIKADGSVAYIYDRGYLIYEKGTPVRMVGAMQDITGRKLSEQLLRESEANLRTIFDNTDSAYVFLDKQLNIVSFNQCAKDVYQYEFENILRPGVNLINILPADRQDDVRKKYEKVLGGKKLVYETKNVKPDQSVHWYNFIVSPVYDSAGTILGMVIESEDITHRKNVELEKEKVTADLIQRNKTLEQFAYIISHNLRSPVANITGLSNIILNSKNMDPSDQRKCMEGLALSVKKLDSVIIDLNNILQVRREISERKESVRFSALVKDIKTSINSLIKKEGITIKTNFISVNELFSIKSYLTSVFYNLITNSIKYRRPGVKPIIEIKSQRVNNVLFLTFKDNGLGIDMESNSGKIFGLYKKFHPHIEGKGMGLYMVKTQVEMLGGKIDIKSEVNKGTEFIIEFAL